MIQKKHFSLASITLYSLMLMALCIPLHKKMFVPCAIISFVISLLQFRTERVFEKLKNNKTLYILIAYYCLVAFSLLYTDNMKEGLFDLEIKLSFILFPVYFFIFPLQIDEKVKTRVFSSFIAGVLLGIIICLINAGLGYLEKPVFYYTFAASAFSILHHPTYYAMYINFAIIILLVWQRQHKIQSFPAIFGVIALLGTNWLLMSRAGLLTSILIVFVYWITLFFEKKIKGALILLFLFLISTLAVFNYSSYAKYRMSTIVPFVHDLFSGNTDDNTSSSPSDSRMITWNAALYVISENPLLGVGSGDVHFELNNYYEQKNHDNAIERSLNAHNQFLQSWVAAGVLAFLFILLILIAGIAKGRKSKDLIILCFFIVSIITMLTESIFETQSGVVFFAFFTSLFYSMSNEKSSVLEDQDPKTKFSEH